jgi:LmbE family N-acetylglucosaminyl deacetylase
MSILVVAAHPDDEILGCGGTMAKTEDDVYIAILGEGITSRYNNRDEADKTLIEALHKKSNEVAHFIGAKELTMFSLPDNRFDQIPLLDVIKIVEKLIVDYTPHTIYTHHYGDLNIDHVVTHRAVLTASRPVAGCPVKDVYTFEVPSSTEWSFQGLNRPFHPNVFVNIAETMEQKIDAMEMYEGEARPYPHPRSPQALKAIAQRWGSNVDLEYAEAFELVRSIRNTP